MNKFRAIAGGFFLSALFVFLVQPAVGAETAPVEKLLLDHSAKGDDTQPGKTMTIQLPGGPGTPGGVPLEMVWIPPGKFMMGSPKDEAAGSDNERPQHEVTIAKGFWLGKYEVTQGQWQAVMKDNPSRFKGDDKRPVEMVSWFDCETFVHLLNAEGRGGFRFPTESEWEYACRAGTTTAFSFGDAPGDFFKYGNYCDKSNTDSRAWQDTAHSDGFDKTAPVGSFKPNAWGLYDMHGNVCEWCQDWYHNSYKGAPVDGTSCESLPCQHRVMRGGSWLNQATSCRSAHRGYGAPRSRDENIGFRLVRNP